MENANLSSEPQEFGQGDQHLSETRLSSSKLSSEQPRKTETTHISSDDSDSDTNQDVLYEDLPEFQDITPIPLVEGSVMPIAYSDKFKSVFGYFRAIVATGEFSLRALRICEDAARLNAANYVVWMYRRKVLEHLKLDYRLELEYVAKVIKSNPKNYQVWFHRQRMVEALNDPSNELTFTTEILLQDAKNYHAWQYRQFVLKRFDMLENDELKYTNELIKKDPFNNSAWMHRYFIADDLPKSCGKPSLLDGPILEEEIRYTLGEIANLVHNESPWSYLRGILRDRWDGDHYKVVYSFCLDLYEHEFRSPFLLAFMVDMFDEDLAQGFQAVTDAEKIQLLKKVEAILFDLAENQDKIRKTYWTWLADKFRSKYSKFM